MSLDRVVLGLDGSEGSTHAMEWCLGLADQLDIEVLAVHALSPLIEWELSLPPFDSDEWVRAATEQFRDEWCRPLRDAQVAHQTIILEDYPVHGLISTAERHKADLIVVGAHGHGGLRDRMVGGVSQKLIQRSEIPVVVIPPHSPPPPGLGLSEDDPGWTNIP